MNDENRRLEVPDEFVWRPARIHRRIGPGRYLEFPIRKPQLFRRAVHTFEIVNAVMRDKYFEAKARSIFLSLDTIANVTAITGAVSTNPIFIDERIAT